MSPNPSLFHLPRSPRRVTPFSSCATELKALDRGALFQLARSLARRAARALGRRDRGVLGDEHFERQATGLCLVEALGRIPSHRPLSAAAIELVQAIERSLGLIAATWEADLTAETPERRREAGDLVSWLTGSASVLRRLLINSEALDEARAELGAALRAARCVAAERGRCAAELAWQQTAIAAAASREGERAAGPELGLIELRAIIKNEPRELPALVERLRAKVEDGALRERSVRLAAAFGHPVAYALYPEARKARLEEAFEGLSRAELFALSARCILQAIAPIPLEIRGPIEKALAVLDPADAASLRRLERASLLAARGLRLKKSSAEPSSTLRDPVFGSLAVLLSSALRGHLELARAMVRPWSPVLARAMAVDASLVLKRCVDIAGRVDETWGEAAEDAEAPRARAYRWQRQMLCRLLLSEEKTP